ncbi:MAG TPA: pentapeptide repeat-containing protein, partial [Baekduia sp.]
MSIPTDSERTAPLSVARQAWLSERLAQEPDVRRGRFPFRDTTLARADIEWLLSDLPAAGLDLRGAILRGGDLESLSLTGVLLGLAHRDWVHATQEERRSAAADLSGADLRNARLDRAELSSARLESANLIGARLNGARAAAAIFEHANLSLATCNGAV